MTGCLTERTGGVAILIPSNHLYFPPSLRLPHSNLTTTKRDHHLHPLLPLATSQTVYGYSALISLPSTRPSFYVSSEYFPIELLPVCSSHAVLAPRYIFGFFPRSVAFSLFSRRFSFFAFCFSYHHLICLPVLLFVFLQSGSFLCFLNVFLSLPFWSFVSSHHLLSFTFICLFTICCLDDVFLCLSDLSYLYLICLPVLLFAFR